MFAKIFYRKEIKLVSSPFYSHFPYKAIVHLAECKKWYANAANESTNGYFASAKKQRKRIFDHEGTKEKAEQHNVIALHSTLFNHIQHLRMAVVIANRTHLQLLIDHS